MSDVVKDLTEKVKEQRKEIERKTLSVEEFAKVMDIGKDAARQMCRSSNPPPYIKIGNRYRIIISRLDQWIDSIIGQSF